MSRLRSASSAVDRHLLVRLWSKTPDGIVDRLVERNRSCSTRPNDPFGEVSFGQLHCRTQAISNCSTVAETHVRQYNCRTTKEKYDKAKNNHTGVRNKRDSEKEISASEKRLDAKTTGLDVKVDKIEQRLDAKIDIATEVMKAHINSRIAHVDTRFDGLEQKMETRFNKSERYFEQLVGMVVQQNKKIDRSLERIENH